MWRSRRLALSAACAVAALVAAGRLAGDARFRTDAADPDSVARAAGSDTQQLATATTKPMRVAATRGDAASDHEPDRRVPPSAHFDPAPDPATFRRDAGSAAPIVLDDPQTALGTAVAIHGRDPAAPRAIELWRVSGPRSARVATGRSRDDGTLELPALVLPAGEVVLVASPRGAGPDAAAASQPVRASRDPSSPQLVAREERVDASGASWLSLRLEPAEPEGEIVVLRVGDALDAEDGPPVEALRTPIVAGADGARQTFDVLVALEPGDTEVRIAQELVDGRRSPWRTVPLDRRNQENEDVVAVVEVAQP